LIIIYKKKNLITLKYTLLTRNIIRIIINIIIKTRIIIIIMIIIIEFIITLRAFINHEITLSLINILIF
jgi:hypothetical protein